MIYSSSFKLYSVKPEYAAINKNISLLFVYILQYNHCYLLQAFFHRYKIYDLGPHFVDTST